MGKADVGFRRAMFKYFAANPVIEGDGVNFGLLTTVLTKNEKKLLNVTDANAHLHIGFSDAVFDHTDKESNFWVKPDFVLRNMEISSQCIIFEHCGSWQNFYQKRFMYEENRLAFFDRQDTVWILVENIEVVAVFYILPNDDHSRRVVRATPQLGNEFFGFNYEEFRAENYSLDVQEYVDQASTREQVVDEFNVGAA